MHDKAGPTLRREIRTEMREWVKVTWRHLAVIAAFGVATLLMIWVVPGPSFWRGFQIGAFSVAWVGIIGFVLLAGPGQQSRLWGLAGEIATAEEFTSRRRRRQGWQILNGLMLGAEIDHVAIGPGGVLAIESKWRNSDEWQVSASGIVGALCDPISQVQRNANFVRGYLKSRRGGSHDVDVIPVLVIWGPGCPIIAGGSCVIDGVHVFSGESLGVFQSWLDEQRLDRPTFEALQRSVAAYGDDIATTAARKAAVATRTTWHDATGLAKGRSPRSSGDRASVS